MSDTANNAGGVLVSYFEWVQNNQNDEWSAEQIDDKLRDKMQRAVDTVLQRNGQLCEDCASDDTHSALLRTAALAVAVERVARTTLLRGIWP